jgi:hypothetical protein
MSRPIEPEAATRFLNVDLELVSTGALGPLLAALAREAIVLRDRVDGGKQVVWLELGHQPAGIEEAIHDFTRLIEALPPELRRVWDGCEDRCLNVGVQGGLGPHASAFTISASAVAAAAAVSARLEFTVYGAGGAAALAPASPTP